MRITACFIIALAALAACSGQRGLAREYTFDADLDPFLSLPGSYELTPGDLEKMFPPGEMTRNPYFEWLNRDKTRAIFKRNPAGNVTVDLSVLEGKVPVQEMIVDFKDGLFLGVTLSLFNRGDAGSLPPEAFDLSFRAMGRHLGQQLAARPVRREGNIRRGVLTSGYTWISARGMAVLEHNPEAPGDTEFLRVRLCRRDAGGSYAAAMRERAEPSVRQSDLPRNVVRDGEGNIHIAGIPMVDQGAKGYCVVASVQRLFEYYGIPCDMHQLAQIAEADPDRGTSSLNTSKELGAIDHLFKMRYETLALRSRDRLVELVEEDDRFYEGDEFDKRDFEKAIERYIGDGIPLLWSLEVGRFREEPAISPQTSGGHMRLITGYNKREGKIIFSDSWGAGHEFKTMVWDDAFEATTGLYFMKPVTN